MGTTRRGPAPAAEGVGRRVGVGISERGAPPPTVAAERPVRGCSIRKEVTELPDELVVLAANEVRGGNVRRRKGS